MNTFLLSTTVVLLVGGAVADETRHTNVITADSVKWTENAAFPKGVQIATLVGDPTKTGETVVQRIKFPPNFTMPPHTHPFSEVVTIISGNIGTNSGGKPEKNGGLLQPGSMWVYPAGHAHYAWTGDGEAFSKSNTSDLEALHTSTWPMIAGMFGSARLLATSQVRERVWVRGVRHLYSGTAGK